LTIDFSRQKIFDMKSLTGNLLSLLTETTTSSFRLTRLTQEATIKYDENYIYPNSN
jgi:hypothetical protein